MTDSTPAVSEQAEILRDLRDIGKTDGWVVANVAADWIESLTGQLADARRDAERYAWVKREATVVLNVPAWVATVTGAPIQTSYPVGDELDAAIDAAMSGGTGQPNDIEAGGTCSP